MGVLTIEIPQEITRSFRLDDSEFSAQIIDELEMRSSGSYPGNVRPPRRNDRKEALKEILGIWSDRPESADEIAKHLRRLNNGLE